MKTIIDDIGYDHKIAADILKAAKKDYFANRTEMDGEPLRVLQYGNDNHGNVVWSLLGTFGYHEMHYPLRSGHTEAMRLTAIIYTLPEVIDRDIDLRHHQKNY